MKQKFYLFSMLLIAALFSGCPDPAPKNPVFELGKAFSIMQGLTMQTADNDLNIYFDKVSGDSRCPENVECIWAGRADCLFTLTSNGDAESVTLSSGDFSQGGSGQASFKGYTITLKNIEPPKVANTEIEQKDYKATLTVTK